LSTAVGIPLFSLLPRPSVLCDVINVVTEFMVSAAAVEGLSCLDGIYSVNRKRGEHLGGKPLVTCLAAFQVGAKVWEPMASSSVHSGRQRAPYQQ
jgi:hypothetical protein